MVTIRLIRDLKSKSGWTKLNQEDPRYNNEEVNGYKIVKINEMLWSKVENMIFLKKKGWDSPIMIDGKRRSGKSTLGKTIAYLIDPDITIKNFVAGLEDSLDAIENVKDESALVFDESSLSFGSKDSMKKAQNQLLKIIDVVGQKRLTLIFILPSFFELNRTIALTHTLFLIHVYPDEKLDRGRFAYFGTKTKKKLYEIGKKNFNSYDKPQADFIGLFDDFLLPFEDEYINLKKQSLRQALNPKEKKTNNKLLESQIKTKLINDFKENCPHIKDKDIAKGFGISTRAYYRRRMGFQDKTDEPSR